MPSIQAAETGRAYTRPAIPARSVVKQPEIHINFDAQPIPTFRITSTLAPKPLIDYVA